MMMMMQAVLPPPFPSTSPQRCYVSNMAVARGFRRRGAATALLHSCSRLGAALPRMLEAPAGSPCACRSGVGP